MEWVATLRLLGGFGPMRQTRRARTEVRLLFRISCLPANREQSVVDWVLN